MTDPTRFGTDPSNTKNVFLASLARCEVSPGFMESFYHRFISMSPSVRAKFSRTDMALQGRKLLGQLRMLANAVCGDPESLRELAERAKTHDRDHLNITPDMYELWHEALIVTAAEHDPGWDPETRFAWDHTLTMLVNYMIKRY